MNRDFAEQWLNDLKKYWFNKDIESAVSLFNKTTFYQAKRTDHTKINSK